MFLIGWLLRDPKEGGGRHLYGRVDVNALNSRHINCPVRPLCSHFM
jgi:hypothetical protein